MMRWLGLAAVSIWLMLAIHTIEAAPARGWLSIPALALAAPVEIAPIVDHEYMMGDGVYWLTGTYWIDADHGRIALAAHAGGLFANLNELVPGDLILILVREQRFIFRVSSWRTVDPDRLAAELARPASVLTLDLWTCQPSGWYVVTAELIL